MKNVFVVFDRFTDLHEYRVYGRTDKAGNPFILVD